MNRSAIVGATLLGLATLFVLLRVAARGLIDRDPPPLLRAWRRLRTKPRYPRLDGKPRLEIINLPLKRRVG